MKPIMKSKTTGSKGEYQASDIEITLPDHDCDIDCVLSNGQKITLQFRIESPSLDILLPERMPVYNWRGNDMKPAYIVSKTGCCHNADQLMIPLNPGCLGPDSMGEEVEED
jgi:hypothetical protein